MDFWISLSSRGTVTLPRQTWEKMGHPEMVFVSADPSKGIVEMRIKDDKQDTEPRKVFSSSGGRSPQVSILSIINKMGIEKVIAGHRHAVEEDGIIRIELCNYWKNL